MTRRLVVVLLIFTTLVLALSVVPLGVATSSRDRGDYATATRAIALSLASLAEDAFDDTRRPVSPVRLTSAVGPDATAQVLDLSGRRVVASGAMPPTPARVLADARSGRTTSTWDHDDVVAAAPVVADGVTRGVLVVRRPDEPVEHRIARLWTALGAVAAVALLLSIALAVGAARWVGAPLRRLGDAAQQWSEGSLHERADPSLGPPELREVAAALNVMAERLDTLLHGSRAVVADVSHQLRTPLAAMRLRVELVRDEVSKSVPDADEDLAVTLAEIDRLSRIVDGLLAVAKAESADSALVPVDAVAVTRERRQAWLPVAEDRGVTLTVSTDSDSATALATPGHLDQVLDNLLDNALTAVADGGHVDVTVAGGRDRIAVSVRDDGPGMTPEQQERAFHRFASGRGDGGAGLGLAVVHRLVTADGGAVDLVSGAGGTTVTVRLVPARRAAVTPDARLR